MKNVAILLSTYNGERFLSEQINSILTQNYKDWKLYIRDDGSTDNTQQIIRKYANQDSRIIFTNEDNVTNVGVKRSFFTLLQNANADYYMFCDQDDVWLPDKVSETVAVASEDAPLLIHTDLKVVDSTLNTLGLMYDNDFHDAFHDALFSNSVTGCTMLLNQKLKNIILSLPYDTNKIVMHDWWFSLIAATFGKIIFLKKPNILYRQHGDNTFGANVTAFQRLQRLFKMKKEVKRFAEAYVQDNYFYDICFDQLNVTQKSLLKAINLIFTGNNGLHAARILAKYRIRKTTLKGTLMLWYVSIFKFKEMKVIWSHYE